MSNIQRLTLISNPTNEFPKNANNSFKVRLPERLSLPGEGWHPLMHTSFRLLEPWMLTHLKQRRKMKGGTVFLQVHTHAQSVEGPVCVPGEPRKMVDGHGPTPTRYKKDTPLNAVDSQHHVTQFV